MASPNGAAWHMLATPHEANMEGKCHLRKMTVFDDWNMMDNWGAASALWMIIGMLVVAVVVLVGVWLIVRSSRRARSSSSSALDILRERFARGEITKDEFEAAKRTLGV